jgi:cytochrome bd-type quinol oxidase subunit 2
VLKRIKQIVAVVTLGVVLALPGVSSVQAQNIQDSLCSGAELSTTATDCATSTADAGSSVNDLIADVINIFSLVVGVVSVIMIIYGGFRYITSGGESNSVSSAKNTILYAIIGLVIVALAQFIVRFVLGRVTDAT